MLQRFTKPIFICKDTIFSRKGNIKISFRAFFKHILFKVSSTSIKKEHFLTKNHYLCTHKLIKHIRIKKEERFQYLQRGTRLGVPAEVL